MDHYNLSDYLNNTSDMRNPNEIFPNQPAVEQMQAAIEPEQYSLPSRDLSFFQQETPRPNNSTTPDFLLPDFAQREVYLPPSPLFNAGPSNYTGHWHAEASSYSSYDSPIPGRASNESQHGFTRGSNIASIGMNLLNSPAPVSLLQRYEGVNPNTANAVELADSIGQQPVDPRSRMGFDYLIRITPTPAQYQQQNNSSRPQTLITSHGATRLGGLTVYAVTSVHIPAFGSQNFDSTPSESYDADGEESNSGHLRPRFFTPTSGYDGDGEEGESTCSESTAHGNLNGYDSDSSNDSSSIARSDDVEEDRESTAANTAGDEEDMISEASDIEGKQEETDSDSDLTAAGSSSSNKHSYGDSESAQSDPSDTMPRRDQRSPSYNSSSDGGEPQFPKRVSNDSPYVIDPCSNRPRKRRKMDDDPKQHTKRRLRERRAAWEENNQRHMRAAKWSRRHSSGSEDYGDA